MRRNRMRKSTRDPFSGTRRRAGGWALYILGAAAVVYMTCAVILPAMTAGPETREPFAPEQVRLKDSYEAESGGFVMSLRAEQAGELRAEKKGKAGPVRELVWSPAALSAASGEIDTETDELPSVSPEPASPQEEPQVELHVEAVTEGAHYEALMAQVTEEADGWTAPPQVMELTASLDGRKLDLSGCQITVQVDPNRALVEAAMEDAVAAVSQEEESGEGEKAGMVLTVLPLGGESVVRLFTSEEMESGEPLPAVAVTYTVPEGAPALYAVSAHTAQVYRTVDGSRQVVVEGEMIIDLEGGVTECATPLTPAIDTETGEPYDANSFLFLVKSGATLTITDSGTGGGITANGLSSLITVEAGGTLNIQGGTLRNNGSGASRVIFADGNSTVNMSGGTITGGKIWTGAGIYMTDGTVNIYDGEIINNTADKGGGVYTETGTVNIYGGRITNNTAAVYGGGVYANTGTVNIYGGEITGNTAVGGGGVCAFDGRVVMQEGEIFNNKASSDWEGGGGVYAKTMELSDGEIRENEALYSGGGIYVVESVTMTGGKISSNHVTGSNPNARGGGVSADLMIMRGGEISSNTTPAKGGGVYAARMMMTNGTVSGNKVQGTNAIGGGGIFIAQGTPVFNDGGMAERGIYNMSVTGGTIRGNESDHVGGGIYVDVGAKVHIRGTSSSPIYITGNSASDKNDLAKPVHGFAGGGIFVEHPNNVEESIGVVNKNAGGQLYLYDAVVTGNSAKYGGGVAGCGASSIMISSASGVAVYQNTITGTAAQDIRYPWSTDLYCDGKGRVDSQIGGKTWVTWVGRQKDRPHISIFELKDLPTAGANGETVYENGFYLNATHFNTGIATQKATVFIQGNTSMSGGGGIGGNGYMELGFQPPEQGTLELRKIVEGSDAQRVFKFTVALKGSDGKPYMGIPSISNGDGTDLSLERDENGAFMLELKHGEFVRFTGLPVDTQYTITEEQVDGFQTVIVATGEESVEGGSVSGTLKPDVGSLVEFTNTTIPYELPETGGTPTVIWIGAVLLIAVAAGILTKKCVKGKESRQ